MQQGGETMDNLYRSSDEGTPNYIFLGPVKRVISYEGECPIGIDYELTYPIPADVYDHARGA